MLHVQHRLSHQLILLSVIIVYSALVIIDNRWWCIEVFVWWFSLCEDILINRYILIINQCLFLYLLFTQPPLILNYHWLSIIVVYTIFSYDNVLIILSRCWSWYWSYCCIVVTIIWNKPRLPHCVIIVWDDVFVYYQCLIIHVVIVCSIYLWCRQYSWWSLYIIIFNDNLINSQWWLTQLIYYRLSLRIKVILLLWLRSQCRYSLCNYSRLSLSRRGLHSLSVKRRLW